MKYQCNFDQRAKAFKIKDLSYSNDIVNFEAFTIVDFVKSLPNDSLTIVRSLDNGMKLYLKSYSLIIQLVL